MGDSFWFGLMGDFPLAGHDGDFWPLLFDFHDWSEVLLSQDVRLELDVCLFFVSLFSGHLWVHRLYFWLV